MKNGKNRINIATTVICVIFLVSCLCVRGINRNINYNKAVECLSVGDYDSALEIFDALGSYRDSRQLVNYALALRSSDSGDLSADMIARTYISRISENYTGDLSEQIREFRICH